MPPVRNISRIANGWQVTFTDKTLATNGQYKFTRTDLPASLRNSTDLAAIETYINTQIQNFLTFTDADGIVRQRFYAKVRVISNAGGVLVVDAIVSDEPIVGSWWL